MIFRKNKPNERKGKVLFINVSKEYEQHPDVRKLNRLGDQHIEKVSDIYREYAEVKGFSRIVPLEEIKENNNLHHSFIPKIFQNNKLLK